ncbi:MAG: sensor histidine kinase [Anaerolineae bacterium]
MFAFTKFSLTRQFMLTSFLIFLAGMIGIGSWVGRQIERGVIERTGAITSLYVDSYVSHYLQDLSPSEGLKPEDVASLDRLMAESPLGQAIVSFKVWAPDNRILYSSDSNLINRQYDTNVGLIPSFAGEVTSRLSDLSEPENAAERRYWNELIETYAPIRAMGSGEVIAVSEFYQVPDELQAEIRRAQLQSWLVVGVVMFMAYLLLAGLVKRASNTIVDQQAELREKVNQIEQLHARVRLAAARTTALNERFLRRVSADLHDGPGQDLALALLRVESLVESCGRCPLPVSIGRAAADDYRTVQTALGSALAELRAISAGLRSPEIESLSVAGTAQRAVRNYERKTHCRVTLTLGELPDRAPLSVKITLYRVLQEALNNGYRHARGAGQTVWVGNEGEDLCVEISDEGQGFDPDRVSANGHLGLAGMRERVRVLGGSFSIESQPGQGTTVRASLPLTVAEANNV